MQIPNTSLMKEVKTPKNLENQNKKKSYNNFWHIPLSLPALFYFFLFVLFFFFPCRVLEFVQQTLDELTVAYAWADGCCRDEVFPSSKAQCNSSERIWARSSPPFEGGNRGTAGLCRVQKQGWGNSVSIEKRDFIPRERVIEVSNKSSRVSRSGSQNISEKEKAMQNKFHPLCNRCWGAGTGSLRFLPTQTSSVIF